MNIARPALRYFGGKFLIAPWIISHFPAHTTYCEPFSGGFSVGLRKPPAKIEVYNDLNGLAVNFFKVLRERPDDLVRVLRLTPFSRREYLAAQQPATDDLEAARRFYTWCWQGRGRGGVIEQGGWRFMKSDSRSQTPCDDWAKIEHLYAIAQRLLNVQIESVDALRCIDLYDTPETLYYVDPPYVHGTRSIRWGGSSYLHEMTDDDHAHLAEKLHSIQGMAIISGYPSDLYDKLYKDWQTSDKMSRKDTGEKVRQKTIERLWIKPNVSILPLFSQQG